MVDLATLMLLNELMDSDAKKPHRGKTRSWIKRRRDRGYFNNIIRELRIEDRFGFREMFRMDVIDFEYVLGKISDIISPKKRLFFLLCLLTLCLLIILLFCCKAILKQISIFNGFSLELTICVRRHDLMGLSFTSRNDLFLFWFIFWAFSNIRISKMFERHTISLMSSIF